MQIETQRLLIRDIQTEDEIPFVQMATDGSLMDCGFGRDCGNLIPPNSEELNYFKTFVVRPFQVLCKLKKLT